MSATLESTALMAQTRTLCEAILADDAYKSHMQKVDAFFANESAQARYREATELGHHLQHLQRQGVELPDDQVNRFESLRDSLFENETIAGFIDAQRNLGELQDLLESYIGKTIELGRIPEEHELESEGGCCGGGGCGCSH